MVKICERTTAYYWNQAVQFYEVKLEVQKL
jgi:hypothetical protein